MKGRLRREHEADHAPECVDVGRCAWPRPVDLLRGDVVRGAEQLPGRGDRSRHRSGAADPEIGQEDALAVIRAFDQDVRRLDVAVDDPARVRGIECPRDGGGDGGRAREAQGPLLVDQPVQVRAANQAHRDVEAARSLAGAVDRDHALVLELGREARLALEALAKRAVGGQIRREDLEGPLVVERQVERAVDGPHPSGAEDALDPKPGEQRAGVHVVRVGGAQRGGAVRSRIEIAPA